MVKLILLESVDGLGRPGDEVNSNNHHPAIPDEAFDSLITRLHTALA